MASGRLQRRTFFISGLNYQLEYVKGQKNVADSLSRLNADKVSTSNEEEEVEYVNLVEDELKIDLSGDRTLSKVFDWVRNGWKKVSDPTFMPFYAKRDELSIEQGVLM